MGFGIGLQELLILGCCGTVLLGAIAGGVAAVFLARKDKED